MKKTMLFIGIIMMLLVPSIVSAKVYTLDDFPHELSEGMKVPTLKTGDSIDFSDQNNVNINIDWTPLDKCYGTNSECLRTYEVTKPLVYSTFSYDDYNHKWRDIYFTEHEGTGDVYSVNDMIEGRLYHSNDVITFPSFNYSIEYYDANGEYIDGDMSTLSAIIKKYNNKDVTWKFSILDGSIYAPISLGFQVYEYEEPTFKLTCDKKVINYGEKTKCHLSAISKNQLEEISFSLNTPNFKVSNEKPEEHVTTFDGDDKYNYKIAKGYGVNNIELRIMTFDLEGIKNESYTDDVKAINIHYRDNLYQGSYEELKSDLRVIPYKLKNPQTYKNIAIIFIPIILLITSMFIMKKYESKKEKI